MNKYLFFIFLISSCNSENKESCNIPLDIYLFNFNEIQGDCGELFSQYSTFQQLSECNSTMKSYCTFITLDTCIEGIEQQFIFEFNSEKEQIFGKYILETEECSSEYIVEAIRE